VILGVSFDTVQENRAFAEKFSFPFLLLCDIERKIGMAYGACEATDAGFARRISYLIGPTGTIDQVWAKVDAKAHPKQVLDLLR
jgi:peroxiredoxin Q/BCP